MQVQADSPHPVRGVVFMGMGEPMLNYDRVMRAAEVLSEPCGLAINGKAITISTVGIVPMIRRFTAEKRPYRLVVSLTSADPQRRKELLPIEATHPLPELVEALREYHQATGRRVTLAWTLMAGINTSANDARQLAELTRGLPIVLDLIDVNDPTGQFQRPSAAELNAFRDALTAELGMPVVRRYSGGQDIYAGCGMLAGRNEAKLRLRVGSAFLFASLLFQLPYQGSRIPIAGYQAFAVGTEGEARDPAERSSVAKLPGGFFGAISRRGQRCPRTTPGGGRRC